MKSRVPKRSIVIGRRKTCVSLEDAFWIELKEIARFQCVTLTKLIAAIDSARTQKNLSSAVRIFVLEHLQSKRTGTGSGASRRGGDKSQSTHA
jgi:predicted DNA-binding ribbon-helix-helix protein